MIQSAVKMLADIKYGSLVMFIELLYVADMMNLWMAALSELGVPLVVLECNTRCKSIVL